MSDVRSSRYKKRKINIDKEVDIDYIYDMYKNNKYSEMFDIDKYELNTIQDLISVALHWKKQRKRKRNTNNIEFYKLVRILPHLVELDNMIGMEDLKKNIVYQILFYVQNLNSSEMMHTVITGEPGVGKTTISKIIGNIYTSLGFLSKGTFRIVERKDFVGQYLGETSIKTSKLLESCKGGVLFIDEAYSLGHPEHRDSYSKEALDTLNKFLSENTKDFVCIVAGYANDLDKCFFSSNPGLKRRFPWRYNIPSYIGSDLYKIFLRQVLHDGWIIQKNNIINEEFFNKNKNFFNHNGGDTQNYFDKCKVVHAKRVFGRNIKNKCYIDGADLQLGIELHKDAYNKEEEEDHTKLFRLYT